MNAQKTAASPIGSDPNVLFARRFLRDRREGDHDALYRTYVVLVCVAFLGVPSAWSAANVVALLGEAAGLGITLSVLPAIGSTVVALTAFAPSHAGLVIPTEREFFYFVDGPFGVRATLLTRTVVLYLLVSVFGGAISAIVAVGLGLPVWPGIVVTVSGLGLGGMTAGSLLIRQTTFARKARQVFIVLGSFLAALSPSTGSAGLPALVISAVELSAAVVLIALVPVLLNKVPLGPLEADIASRRVLLAGLMSGDSRALGGSSKPKVRRFRGIRMSFRRTPWVQSLQIDVLSLLRSPIRTFSAATAAVVASLVAFLSGGQVLAFAISLVVLERSFTVFAKGLLDYLDSVGRDRITPHSFWPSILRHTLLPFVLSAACFGLGLLSAMPLAAPSTANTTASLLLLAAPPCVSIMLGGSSGAPVGVLGPVLTPLGDASFLGLVLWMVRGVIPVGLLVLIASNAGLTVAAMVLIPGCALIALVRLRNMSLVEKQMTGDFRPQTIPQ